MVKTVKTRSSKNERLKGEDEMAEEAAAAVPSTLNTKPRTNPVHTTTYPALPYPTLPYPNLPYPTLSYPTLPYPTLPYPTLLYGKPSNP